MSRKRAERLYRDFIGADVDAVTEAMIAEHYAMIGLVKKIEYLSVDEEGNEVVYVHEFEGRPPRLLISDDGRTALVQGGFKFTRRGFVDQ